MKIIILNKFDYWDKENDINAIDFPVEDLLQIGKTKCFDLENKKIIDYYNPLGLREDEWRDEIIQLKNNLDNTDYVASKLSEALAEAQLTGDSTKLQEVWTTYEEVINQRQEWRDRINLLEDTYFKKED